MAAVQNAPTGPKDSSRGLRPRIGKYLQNSAPQRGRAEPAGFTALVRQGRVNRCRIHLPFETRRSTNSPRPLWGATGFWITVRIRGRWPPAVFRLPRWGGSTRPDFLDNLFVSGGCIPATPLGQLYAKRFANQLRDGRFAEGGFSKERQAPRLSILRRSIPKKPTVTNGTTMHANRAMQRPQCRDRTAKSRPTAKGEENRTGASQRA
jgi:hypothetical protein